MKQKTISLLLALALALSLAGCEKEEMVTAPAGVAVQVQTVEAQDIASENTVSGKVTAGSETSVYVTATAKCTAVYVEAGGRVWLRVWRRDNRRVSFGWENSVCHEQTSGRRVFA